MRVLGIDGGIASVGWAVVDIDPEARVGQIVDAGTWMFESPEEATKSGPKLKNADRRMFRGQRTVVQRRAERMRMIRALFEAQGLIETAGKDALRGNGLDPWELRAQGLERRLTPRQWALALGHIAIHRGFRSNKKNKAANPNKKSEDSEMLAAIEDTKEKLAKYETVGQMFARNPEFAGRRRNRGGLFTRSILRDDQEAETRKLFVAQRRFGNEATGDDFRDAFVHHAFWQNPFQTSEDKVGPCLFETGERRTARFAPGFEKFRLYSRLAALRLQVGRAEPRPLTRDQIAGFPKDYGSTATLTYKALRDHLDLDANMRFAGVSKEDEKRDFVSRSGSALSGTRKFRKALEPAIGVLETTKLLADTLTLDRAAEIITFNEDADEIRKRLATTGLGDAAQLAIFDAVERGEFDEFKGAGHISAKAAANIVPGLMRGLRYDEACKEVYGHHSDSAVNSVQDIRSPVARKALGEMLKQIRILEREYGNRTDELGKWRFDRIHVEMARDIGKSIEERGKIEKGQLRINDIKNSLRREIIDTFKLSYVSGDHLTRFQLWKEQNCFCLYSGKYIDPNLIFRDSGDLEVEHIRPWGRFNDDGYHNKTLCFKSSNANKGNRIPIEWFREEKTEREWEEFVGRVGLLGKSINKEKRRHLLNDIDEAYENKLVSRNRNDTRYATRALLADLGRQYPTVDGKKRVFARPGQLTAALRKAWGVEGFKKSTDGARLLDDRHHAVDAMVVAVASESLLQRVTETAKRFGPKFQMRELAEPWDGFRRDVEAARSNIFVARQVVRRERGKAHDATIKQIREVDGEKHVYERKAVEKLTLKDLDLIPIPEAYGKVADPKKLRDEMVETLRAWIVERDAKNGKVEPPRSPKGDVIRKVRIKSSSKPAVLVRGGTADRGDMVRVDVFTRPSKKGEKQFFLVPVYLHEVATRDTPPMRAVQQAAPENNWPDMACQFDFNFSVYPMTLLSIVKSTGEILEGYYRGLDRATGNITISAATNSSEIMRGIGCRTLNRLSKLQVDRLGRVSEVEREVRLWRGKACISPDPHGSALPMAN